MIEEVNPATHPEMDRLMEEITDSLQEVIARNLDSVTQERVGRALAYMGVILLSHKLSRRELLAFLGGLAELCDQNLICADEWPELLGLDEDTLRALMPGEHGAH
jgi:hypothetical protein